MSRWSEFWRRKGKTLLEKGTFSEAVAAFTKALEWNPESADTWWERGEARLLLQETEAAMEDFCVAILLESQRAEFYISRGNILGEWNACAAALADYQQALELSPEKSLVAYYGCGKIYYTQEDYSHAEFCMKQVLEEDSDFLPAKIRLGYCLLVRHAAAEAVRWFREAKETLEESFSHHPDFTDMRHFLREHRPEEVAYVDSCYGWIRCCVALRENEEGIRLCDQVLAYLPDCEEVRIARGELRLAIRQTEEALEDFQHVLRNHPDCGVGLARKGMCLRLLRRWEEAIAAYEEARLQHVKDPDVLVGWGICLQKQNRHVEAMAILNQAIEEYPHFAEGYYRRGISYYETQQLPEAQRDFRRAVQINPQNPYYWKDLAMACYVDEDVEGTLFAASQAVERHPKLTEAHLLLAASQRDQGNFQAALEEVKIVLDLDSQCVEGWILLGFVQYHLDHLPEAVEAFTRALERDPNHPMAWSGRASVYTRQQEWEKALRDCRRAVELIPQQIRFHFHLVSLLCQLERWEEALQTCRTMQENFPEQAVPWVMIADIHMKQERPEAAIVALDNALEKAPGEFEILQRKTMVKCSLGLYQAALDDLNSVIAELKEPVEEELYLLRGSIYGKMERWEAALEDVSRVIEKDQENLQAWYQRGMIWMTLRHYEEALNDFDWVVEHDPEAIEPRFSRAFTLLGLFRTEEAFEELEQVLAIRPDFVPALCEKAILLASLGRKEEAIALYNEILRDFPDNARILNFRGTLLASKKHFTDALEDYNRAIESNPDFAPAYNNRGFIYYAKGELESALYNINTAIQLSPDWSRPYLNRAVLYLQMNDLEAAREDVANAIAKARDVGDEDTVVDALALRETIEDVGDLGEDPLGDIDLENFPGEFPDDYLNDLPLEIPEDFQNGLSQEYLHFEIPLEEEDLEDDEEDEEDEDEDDDEEEWELEEAEITQERWIKKAFPTNASQPSWVFQHAPVPLEEFYGDMENFPPIPVEEIPEVDGEEIPDLMDLLQQMKDSDKLCDYLMFRVTRFVGMPIISVLEQVDDRENLRELIHYLKTRNLLSEPLSPNVEKNARQKRQEALWESYLQTHTDRITFESILEDLGDPHSGTLASWEVGEERTDGSENEEEKKKENPPEKEI